MNIIGMRKTWYLLSGFLLAIGLTAVLFGGIKPGLDFSGGSIIEIKNVQSVDAVKNAMKSSKLDFRVVEKTSQDTVLIKVKSSSEQERKNIIESVSKVGKDGQKVEEVQSSTIGPTISKSITTKAYLSITLGLFVIIVYVGWSFRKASSVLSSWKYGVCASLAMLHDTLIVVGLFAILGYFWNIEIDSLFVTALLTVISFSVHDTIVIFDRIRENLKFSAGDNFESVVNKSVTQMVSRSVNTSMVVIFVVVSLFMLGGESIHYFILALLAGMIIGTYSSIFIASPLLVTWKNFELRRKVGKA